MRPIRVPTAAIPGLLLLIFTTCASASTAILGMDFGQEYIKAALVKPGIPLEIVLTKDTKRKEASAIGFKPSGSSVKEGKFAYPERLYGADAVNLAARFPNDVYPNLKQLLGQLEKDGSTTTYLARYPAVNTIQSSSRPTVAFKSPSAPPVGSGSGGFMVEELLAMEFKNIVANAEALAGPGTKIKNVVFTIPAFFLAEEKHALGLAAKLAGLNVMSFVSDGLAVGINYATTRTFDENTPEYHIIYDMGAGSTTATVLKFQGKSVKDVGKFNKTIQEVSVLGVGYDRTLGGDLFNQKIFDVLLGDFVASSKAKELLEQNPELKKEVKLNGRAAAKLWREATRVRQILSANTETTSSVESLFNGIDFRSKVLRSTFEEMLTEYEDLVTKPIMDAIDSSGISLGQINTLILHGGAVRTPFVGKKLEEIMGSQDRISKNVNPDEAAVFGATFKGAAESGGFKVKEIKTHDISTYAVSIKYKKDGESPKETSQQIFPFFAKIGQEKIVPFPKQTDFDFSILFNLPLRPQDPKQKPRQEPLNVVKVQNLTTSVQKLIDDFGCKGNDIFTKFTMEIDEKNALPKVSRGWVECTVETVEQSPKKEGMVEGVKGFFGIGKKKDGEQEVLEEADKEADSKTASSKATSSKKGSASAEASAKEEDFTPKIVKKLERIPLGYTIEKDGFPEISQKVRAGLVSKIQGFDKFDKNRRALEEARNELEAFSYRGREYLEDSLFINVSTAEERERFESLLSHTGDWLYDEGYTANLAAVKQKLSDLKALEEPITNRKIEHQKRPEELKALEDVIDEAGVVIKVFTTRPPTPDSELGDSEKVPKVDTKTLEKRQGETKAWLAKVRAEQEAKADYEDPVFTVQELQKKKRDLRKLAMDVVQQQQIMDRNKQAETKAASSASAAAAASASASAASASSAAEAEATPYVLEEVVEEKKAEKKNMPHNEL